MSNFNYIQMPPDGTGKKSKQTVVTIVDYNSGVLELELGDTVTTDAGFIGSVIDKNGNIASGGHSLNSRP